MTRVFFDTEFYEDGRTIQLISIGIMREDGEQYYAETPMAEELAHASDWLRENVLPHLTGGEAVKPRHQIAREIVDFVGPSPEFWAYYADYDWVALCQLYGRMIDLPKGWPMFCRDIKQLAVSLGNPKLPEQTADHNHDAMYDAAWNRQAYSALIEQEPHHE